MKKIAMYLTILLLDATGVVLIGAQHKLIGASIMLLGLLALAFSSKQLRKDLSVVYFGIALLGITPITTDISYGHVLLMGTCLVLAIAVPYLVSRYVFKDYAVRFKFSHGRKWYKTEISYVFITAVVTYLLFPFMLKNTGSYLNWTVDPGVSYIFRLFIGTNALGIWDELFFICTVLGMLRRHLPFRQANVAQAVLFTSFLYELGFRGWSPVVIFVFALVQGFIFMKTESLFYVITIHLVADFVLFLALISLNHPAWLPIFLTK